MARGRIADLPAAEQIERVEALADRLTGEIEQARPAGATAAKMSREQVRYYAWKEQLHQVRERLRGAGEALAAAKRRPPKSEVTPRSPTSLKAYAGNVNFDHRVSARRMLRDIHAAQDIHEYLRDAAADIPQADELAERLAALRLEATWLGAMHAAAEQPEETIVIIHALNAPARTFANRLYWLVNVLNLQFGFDGTLVHFPMPESQRVAFRVAGPGIWPLVAGEAGIHVLCRQHENLLPVQIIVQAVTGEPPREQVDAFYRQREAWLAEMSQGRSPSEMPTLGPLVRFYDEAGPTLDLRSGLSFTGFPSPEEWKRLMLAGLPLPPELEVP